MKEKARQILYATSVRKETVRNSITCSRI